MKQIIEISLKVFNDFEVINNTSIYKPLDNDTNLASLSKEESTSPFEKNKFKYLALKFLGLFGAKNSSNKSSVFTTALALLISQPSWRAIMLKTSKMRTRFVEMTKQVALMYDVNLDTHELELLEKDYEQPSNLQTLAKRVHALGEEKIKQVQCLLLDELERPAVTSSLKVSYASSYEQFDLITRYVKYKVHAIEPSGHIIFQCQKDKGTCSVRTCTSIFPDTRGVIGQRSVWANQGQLQLGSYSGELCTTHHILEQILCSLQLTEQHAVLDTSECEAKELCLLFTSLYAWNDLDLISQQRDAIQSLHGKTLKVYDHAYRLHLLYMNIPLNTWTRFPTPSETGAVLQDINDQALIWMTYSVAQKLHLPLKPLKGWIEQLQQQEKDFFLQEQKRLAIIDAFNLYKMDFLPYLTTRKEPIAAVLHALLSNKRPDGKKLCGMDALLYLNQLTQFLGIVHHKNSERALHRSSAAKAADQAQFVLTQLTKQPFLPGQSNPEQQHLFEVLYSLYLLKEEPELNQLMGLGENAHFQTTLAKNAEIRRYLLV